MSADPVISVETLGKRYTLGVQAAQPHATLRESLTQKLTAPGRWWSQATRKAPVTAETAGEFWALRDVSFTINRGEVTGVIGRNGAGKSTLLKVLSRITEPTIGRVKLRGRVASLLEVGTGFHPELTGRENIYLNGAILGMTRMEIRQRFDEIIAFAEIERFLDTPVKRYSSGMYVRLAFAVAAHMEPEILIVDEVLAVGDAAFQRKCLGKMQAVASGQGRTVLLVSHNLATIQSLCQQCIVLDHGRLVAKTTPGEAVRHYLEQNALGDTFSRPPQSQGQPTLVTGTIRLEGNDVHPLLRVRTTIQAGARRRVCLEVRLHDNLGQPLAFGSLGRTVPEDQVEIAPGDNLVEFTFPAAALANGYYQLSLHLTEPFKEYLDRADLCLAFELQRPPEATAGQTLDQSWGYGSWHLPVKRA
jgi:lipopolysaccharide transport system ATP-binding protein